METPVQIPDSNVDIVAFNLVNGAIIDDVNNPGTAIASLLEAMAGMCRNMGAEIQSANKDWQDSMLDVAEARNAVDRQGLTLGNTWALSWLVTHMAKRLYHELERTCMESPVASAIESITYSNSGDVETWKTRS